MNRTSEQPWTLGRLLDWTTKFLAEKGSEFPRLDAEVLLAHAQGCKRIELYTRFEELAKEEVRTRFRELVKKRVEGCPVAYLVGRKEFFSLELEVGPAVLIPRPDTETLVMTVLELAKPRAACSMLDVGTGSGCIAIALAKQLRTAQVTAVDISSEALEVARRNAAKHKLSERIRFLDSDLFKSVPETERFDFIVSNPPYIATGTIPTLPVGVREFEPKLALDGGAGGYEVARNLIQQAGTLLKPQGWLILEIGSDQEKRVRQMLEESGYVVAPTIKDYSGNPRVLKAQWKG